MTVTIHMGILMTADLHHTEILTMKETLMHDPQLTTMIDLQQGKQFVKTDAKKKQIQIKANTSADFFQ